MCIHVKRKLFEAPLIFGDVETHSSKLQQNHKLI